jgi:acyl-CoA reductase-like NAD-dependent aldehyde dehydrogenase
MSESAGESVEGVVARARSAQEAWAGLGVRARGRALRGLAARARTDASLIFPHKPARVAWQPRGVVEVIGSGNFPLLNNFGDCVAPLLAGNSVVGAWIKRQLGFPYRGGVLAALRRLGGVIHR